MDKYAFQYRSVQNWATTPKGFDYKNQIVTPKSSKGRGYFQTFLVNALIIFLVIQMGAISSGVASGLAVSLSASTENFSLPGQEIVFAITLQNTSLDSDINDISVTDYLTGLSQTGLMLGLGESEIISVSKSLVGFFPEAATYVSKYPLFKSCNVMTLFPIMV